MVNNNNNETKKFTNLELFTLFEDVIGKMVYHQHKAFDVFNHMCVQTKIITLE